MSNTQIAPSLPLQSKRNIFCMIGDEPLMFQESIQLNSEHYNHYKMMRQTIAFYTAALVPVSNMRDVIILDKFYQNNLAVFNNYISIYQNFGISFSQNFLFTEMDDVYPKALDICDDNDNLISICFSHQLKKYTDITQKLIISQLANSKINLVKLASDHGLPIPESYLTTKDDLEKIKIVDQAFFLKTDGLGGGFNVKEVLSHDDIKSFIKPFRKEDTFIVQKRLNNKKYTEAIADFCITDDSITLINIREKLVDNNQWLGNVFHSTYEKVLSKNQVECLEKCADVIRKKGYFSHGGLNVGIDFFYNSDEIYITEINARWTGGLPIALLIDKLKYNDMICIAYVDEIDKEEIYSYLEFCQNHSSQTLKIFPVSFGPSMSSSKFYIWTMVAGDYTNILNKLPKFMNNFKAIAEKISSIQ